MYNPVSILKTDEGAGCPRPKNPTIILVPVEFVAAEPTREIGDIVMKSDLELIAEKKAIGIYATPSTIECTEESEGDPDAAASKSASPSSIRAIRPRLPVSLSTHATVGSSH